MVGRRERERGPRGGHEGDGRLPPCDASRGFARHPHAPPPSTSSAGTAHSTARSRELLRSRRSAQRTRERSRGRARAETKEASG